MPSDFFKLHSWVSVEEAQLVKSMNWTTMYCGNSWNSLPKRHCDISIPQPRSGGVCGGPCTHNFRIIMMITPREEKIGEVQTQWGQGEEKSLLLHSLVKGATTERLANSSCGHAGRRGHLPQPQPRPSTPNLPSSKKLFFIWFPAFLLPFLQSGWFFGCWFKVSLPWNYLGDGLPWWMYVLNNHG